MDYAVDNPWFAGQASIHTFSAEEMLATKLRALLQRNKGGDLVDLSHSMSVMSVDQIRVVEIFQEYIAMSHLAITRAQAEERMFTKLDNPGFVADIRPLLSANTAESFTDDAVMEAFNNVFRSLIEKLPGDPWARTPEMND